MEVVSYARGQTGFVRLSSLAVVCLCVLRCARHAATMRGGAIKFFVLCSLLLAVNAAAQQQQSVLPEPALQVGPSTR
jgi:hypothetical protein